MWYLGEDLSICIDNKWGSLVDMWFDKKEVGREDEWFREREELIEGGREKEIKRERERNSCLFGVVW